nr:MAG: hypothetical protein [Microvirus sp.]
MYVKAGVQFGDIQPCMVLAALICEQVFKDAGQKFTITSVCDGKHKSASRHYNGLAFDIRIHGVRDYLGLAPRLQDALGSEFDVVVETDHLHVELH